LRRSLMRRWTGLLTLCLMLLLCGVALACPECKDSVANTDARNATHVAAGYKLSIYVMLGAFFAVLGMVVRVLVKAIRD
jgi:heme/copper-type cytochrome/quinol oxidase subunit 2